MGCREQAQRRRTVHLGVRRGRFFHGTEGYRDGPRRDQAWYEDHLLPEGGPERVLGRAPPEGLGEETLGIHRLSDRAVCGEVEGEGSHRSRGGRGGEKGRGRRGRRAENRGGGRGEGEG